MPADLIAPLLALTEAGIPPDIQELLVHGEPSRGIAPGALAKALEASRSHVEADAIWEQAALECERRASNSEQKIGDPADMWHAGAYNALHCAANAFRKLATDTQQAGGGQSVRCSRCSQPDSHHNVDGACPEHWSR